MNIINKIFLKLKLEAKFFLEQKWGIKKPGDSFAISKAELKKYLPGDPVIIDCGAHVGSDSVELARVFPKSKIHAFEPVPEIYDNLLRNTRSYSNITCYKIALSTSTGQTEMFVSSGNSDASSSLLQPTGHLESHPDVFFTKKINVETLTLDDWAAKNKIDKIDFLWLDMQGFELQTLQASKKMLSTVTCIHTEVSLTETYQNAVLYKDYSKWLETQGFKAVIEALPKGADMGNVLFVRK